MAIHFIKDFYKKHERWIPIAFFALGFCFDAAVLRRIDEPKVIIQQAVYILISAILVGVELVESAREVQSPWLLKKVWRYREALLHFLMGTLLNAYTIFYFKSASAITSFIFIIILISFLMINEFKRFGKSQTQVHMAFLSLCLISYFVALAPILLGSIGSFSFLIANLGAIIVFGLYYVILKPKLILRPLLLQTHVAGPFAIILIVFSMLYVARILPPVPLSVSYMGIFHNIERKDGMYELSYTRSKELFWQHGDQTFYARPGDTIYCFARISSPTRFKDQLQVRWFYKDERGRWQPSDAIPLNIVGGREEGYRGVTKKNNYQPGKWRVQIETADNREVGSIGFEVRADDSAEPREIKTRVE